MVFPDWQSLLRAMDTKLHTDANTKEICAAVDECIKVARGSENPLVLNIERDRLMLAACDDDCTMVAEVSAKLREDALGSDQIGVNPKYLMEALDAIDAPIVKIGFTSAMHPLTLSVDDNIRSIIMPMRK